MKSVTKVKIHGNHVIIPDKQKYLVIYKLQPNGTIIINPLFSELWYLLQTIESYSYEISTNEKRYLLPKYNSSTLKSVEINNNGLVKWKANDLEGPIIKDGIELDTIFTQLDYKINYTSTLDTVLNVYTDSVSIDSSITNKLYPIIDSNNNLAVYTGLNGCFKVRNVEELYFQTSNKFTELTLYIEIEIPKCQTKHKNVYLNFTYKNINYKFLVYRNCIKDKTMVNIHINKNLTELYSLIQNTFKIMSLSKQKTFSNFIIPNAIHTYNVGTIPNYIDNSRTKVTYFPFTGGNIDATAPDDIGRPRGIKMDSSNFSLHRCKYVITIHKTRYRLQSLSIYIHAVQFFNDDFRYLDQISGTKVYNEHSVKGDDDITIEGELIIQSVEQLSFVVLQGTHEKNIPFTLYSREDIAVEIKQIIIEEI